MSDTLWGDAEPSALPLASEPPKRPMRNRENAVMIATHGRGPSGATCGTCAYLITDRHHDKTYHKCLKFSLSRSESSDYRKKWPACGLHQEVRP